MAKREPTMEVANFVCRFGDRVMLDYAAEIVIPAFTDRSLVRTFGKSSYLFYDVAVVSLNAETDMFGVCGRFVKDTVLEREQLFDRQHGLVEDHDEIRSSPSSAFLLILNDHRLLYVEETKYAPSIDVFASTAQAFLLRKHQAYIDYLYRAHQKARSLDRALEPVTKAALRETIDLPTVEVTPLPSRESLTAFVQRFKTLRTIEFKVLETNTEIDNEPFFKVARGLGEKLGSDRTTIRHSNTKGLDRKEAVGQVEAASEQGITSVKLAGLDKDGTKLSGDNHDIKIKAPVEELGTTPRQTARRLFSAYVSLVTSKLVVGAKVEVGIATKVKRAVGAVENGTHDTD